MPPQASSRAGSSTQCPVLSIRLCAPVRACASFKNRNASRHTVQRSLGAGLSGGDDEHPRYVVGAVTMLGQRLGEPSVL